MYISLLLLLLLLSLCPTLLRDVALARQRKPTFFALALCNVMPLFFLKSGTLIFALFGITITEGRYKHLQQHHQSHAEASL